MAINDSDLTVIGTPSRVTGRVHGRGALRVEGSLEGDAKVTGPCEVLEGGSVSGNIEARSLTIQGSVIGDVSTSGAVVIGAQASARGAFRCERVVIEPGAQVLLDLDADFELDLSTPPRR